MESTRSDDALSLSSMQVVELKRKLDEERDGYRRKLQVYRLQSFCRLKFILGLPRRPNSPSAARPKTPVKGKSRRIKWDYKMQPALGRELIVPAFKDQAPWKLSWSTLVTANCERDNPVSRDCNCLNGSSLIEHRYRE